MVWNKAYFHAHNLGLSESECVRYADDAWEESVYRQQQEPEYPYGPDCYWCGLEVQVDDFGEGRFCSKECQAEGLQEDKIFVEGKQ